MGADELLRRLDPTFPHPPLSSMTSSSGSSSSSHSTRTMCCTPLIVLDLRPEGEAARSGAGILPKALRLDPALLRLPAAAEAWLQHFDAAKGSHICLVDSSPIARRRPLLASMGIQLWRRLLLGEGDGDAAVDSESDSPRAGANDDADGLVPDSSSSEAYASVTAMARLLHRADFPCVSVLEGGFDALPLCLAARGCTITEPLLISHDAALFRKWRGCSDSDDKSATTTASTTGAGSTSPDHHSRAASSSSTSTVTTTDGRHSPARDALAAAAAAGVGAYKTALKRAEAMGHSVAAAQLRAKLEQAIRHQASAAAVLDEDDAAISSSLHNSSSGS
eukprot:4911-Heterococcus_DN1.PRE.1